jgi:signal transduction histidine kinase
VEAGFFPEAQSHIYRIFQESLTNIGKYAQAIQVSLAIKRRDGGVAFVIKDDGMGFQLEEVQGRVGAERAMGLATMAERVRQ